MMRIPNTWISWGTLGSKRYLVTVMLMGVGLITQAAIEQLAEAERPNLAKPLDEMVPLQIGPWIGRDTPVDPRILRESQADDYLNRVYVHQDDPRLEISLWINFSKYGNNMRHSPEVCLPSSGWSRVESACRTSTHNLSADRTLTISELAYAREDQTQWIGFWYYIFGEGWIQRKLRQLPLTSRSSHGRSTRGSGLTVEIFCPRDRARSPEMLEEFVKDLATALEPQLPVNQVSYHQP